MYRQSTIDVDRRRGDVGRFVAAEEGNDVGDFLRSPEPLEQADTLAAHLLELAPPGLGVRRVSDVHLGSDPARRNAVDPLPVYPAPANPAPIQNAHPSFDHI